MRLLPVEIKAVGTVEALTTIAVKAEISGTLVKTHFREGDTVREGDLLFEIDPRRYREEVRLSEANLARDQAVLAEAEANLRRANAQEDHSLKQMQRYERLASEGIFSREQAEQMAIEARTRRSMVQADSAVVERARASVRAAEAALDSARLNLSYCTIRSPISGRTGMVHHKEGNVVRANDLDLVTIHRVAPVYVSFAVREDRLLTFRQRMRESPVPVTASIPGDSSPPARGAVTFLNNAVDTATGTIRMKATFENADRRLWPGQFVDVRILVEERPNAVVVPASALQTGQAGTFVYIVKPDNTIELRSVAAGPRSGCDVSIEQGLRPDERVVTEGQLRIGPGVKVRVIS